MKLKFLFPALAMVCSVATVSVKAASNNAAIKEQVAGMTEEQKNTRITEMKARVEAIKEMDKSQMSRADRKDMRIELKEMNREARDMGHGGIYISLAGILLIILILILVL